MSKKYWQNFGQLNSSASIEQPSEDEFPSALPLESESLADAKTPRRDFLKYVGFSTAAAAIAAGCEVPVRKVIPYVNKPQDLTPGIADYYATTYVSGSDVIPIIAKVRDGRPIKIEGNELSAVTLGGTTARAQASVLDLYDTARLRFPMADGKEVSSLEQFDKMVGAAIAGSALVLLTPTITSPTTKQIITDFLAKYPGSRHVQYDGISYSGILTANEASYGKRAIPTYQFDKAKVVVGLSADFLGTWINPVEYQRGYTRLRKIDEKNIEMSKHYQFESMMSMTGANADERFTHKPSETGAVALALLNAVNGQPVSGVSATVKAGIEKVAKELLASKGASLVVSGSNNSSIQVIVNAINEAIGANGTTINWASPLLTKQGVDTDMALLVADMEAGKIGSLLIYDANPAYDYFDAERFKAALKKVKTTVSFNERMDETTELVKYVLPAHHYLESWGDVEIKPGSFSMLQPTINPLFKTRQLQDTLLKWSGNTSNYHDYFKNYWVTKLGSEENYEKALMHGVLEAESAAAPAAFNAGKTAEAVAAIGTAKKGGKYELVLYQKPVLGDGRQANNPWLLETPDPITRASWDNYVMISPSLAKELLKVDIADRKQSDEFEVHPDKPILKIKAGNKEVLLPAMIVPGMEANTIAMAVGYGRNTKSGRATVGAGKNVYQFAAGGDMNVPDVSIEVSGEKYKVAQTQTHNSYEGRVEVVKEMKLSDFKKKPDHILEERDKELKPWGGLENFTKEGTIYPYYDKPGIKWGMSIDLNSCFGCGACVVACTAENNVAVVGKSEVLRFHDMAWLRIDRYFSGDPANPDSIQTIFQPMLCQHCDNAPCENVCPVAATNHNSEGINQMIYNRCIGTRYCANNCPYKVRRFNWADYTGADSFPNNQDQQLVGHLDDTVHMMNDDLTRMVLNPDVTVRSRGVIEKCSFCVQRLQEGKLKAKKENRTLTDNDAKTACQQACASDSIVFGNVNNKDSMISTVRRENQNRLFYALEQLHTLPNVNYLAKIRNTEVLTGVTEGFEKEGSGGGAGEERPVKETH
ncbi:MAG TPA: TAT-variant-translocated molybdopterin oxidoreductase [Chitinophagaceae bacterium]|nr:TAT-variant-translocated molybdopterin oxidoreductase [Chitinophagaceae bacterium]